MKTRSIARGIVGSVAALLGVMAAGCSADVSDPQAGEAEIGSTAEALTLSGNAKSDIQFFGSIKLDSAIKNNASPTAHSDNLELIAGGVDSSFNISAKIQVYDRESDTLKPLRNAANTADIDLPTALVEPVIAKIPNTTNVYLITGGRTAADGAVSADSYVLTLALNGSNQISSASIVTVAGPSGTVLPSGRVFTHKSIKQCGSAANQQLIAFGGTTSSSGWESMSGLNATRDIMVFTYDATTPANSDWAPLKDGNNKTTLLRVGRGYAEVLNKTDTEFFVSGGLNNGANAVSSVDFVAVSSSCVADVNHVETDGTNVKVEAATAMPGPLARFASIQTDPSTVSGVAYDFIVGGGNAATIANGTALPTAAYQFDPDGTTSCGVGCSTQGIWRTTGTSIQEGRVFPRFVAANASGTGGLPTVVKLVTGIKPHAASEATDEYYNTSLVNDVFTASTAAWTTGTTLGASKDRVGVFADFLKNGTTDAPMVGLGAKHTNTAGAPLVTPTSMPSDVIAVP